MRKLLACTPLILLAACGGQEAAQPFDPAEETAQAPAGAEAAPDGTPGAAGGVPADGLVRDTLPAEMHGRWGITSAACKNTGYPEGVTEVEARKVTGLEYWVDVERVELRPDGELVVHGTGHGEGETYDDSFGLRLSEDGKTLDRRVIGGPVDGRMFTLQRC